MRKAFEIANKTKDKQKAKQQLFVSLVLQSTYVCFPILHQIHMTKHFEVGHQAAY